MVNFTRIYRVVDFADIEEYALYFLSQLTDFDYLHYRIGSEIKYILIDEFQDTSELQWDALRFLVKCSLKNELKDYSIQDVVNIIHLVLNPDEAIYVSGLLRSPLFRSSYDNLHRWKTDTEIEVLDFKTNRGYGKALLNALITWYRPQVIS